MKPINAVADVRLCSNLDIQMSGASERELWKARFWQGFQNSVESELAVGRGKVRYSGHQLVLSSVLRVPHTVFSGLWFNLVTSPYRGQF